MIINVIQCVKFAYYNQRRIISQSVLSIITEVLDPLVHCSRSQRYHQKPPPFPLVLLYTFLVFLVFLLFGLAFIKGCWVEYFGAELFALLVSYSQLFIIFFSNFFIVLADILVAFVQVVSLLDIFHRSFILVGVESAYCPLEKGFNVVGIDCYGFVVHELGFSPSVFVEKACAQIEQQGGRQFHHTVTLILRCPCKSYRLQHLQSLLIFAPGLGVVMNFEEIIALVLESHCFVELHFEVGGQADLVGSRRLGISCWLCHLIERRGIFGLSLHDVLLLQIQVWLIQ